MRTGGLEGRNYSVPSSVLYTPHPTVGACDSLLSIRTDNTIFGHGIAGRLPLVGGTEWWAAIGWPARIKHSRTKIGRNGREMLSGERRFPVLSRGVGGYTSNTGLWGTHKFRPYLFFYAFTAHINDKKKIRLLV